MKNKILYLTASLFISSFILFAVLKTKTIKPNTTAEFARTSVMITRYDGLSGGSGVIISSTRNESKVLTNAHVCGVVKHGGIVRTDDKRAMVKYYQVSNVHDLCLITVNQNFKVNTVLAKEEPDVYEDAIISGHPALFPTIITRGIFSGKDMINVMTGMRPCTPSELEDPNNILICSFLGGIPVIKTYESQLVSATIMPGSSGSAVFNTEGEIAGLVFAGSGEFGYAMIVPYEYIINFFEIELSRLNHTLPVQDFMGEVSISSIKWKNICPSNDKAIQNACKLMTKSLLLSN